MADEKCDREFIFGSGSGLEIRCHKCGGELPLLHPHIMVERYDDDENMICEWCYVKHSSENK